MKERKRNWQMNTPGQAHKSEKQKSSKPFVDLNVRTSLAQYSRKKAKRNHYLPGRAFKER